MTLFIFIDFCTLGFLLCTLLFLYLCFVLRFFSCVFFLDSQLTLNKPHKTPCDCLRAGSNTTVNRASFTMATNVDAETTPLTPEKQLILRRQRKGTITGHIGTLERLMAEGDINKAKLRLSQMQNTYDTSDAVHWDYIGSLTEEAYWVEHE